MFSLEQYRALRGGAALVDRGTRGRLRLTGSDRRTYLQGLLTNDIASLSAGSGCYAALLTPQGRMISDMNVLETGRDILMDLPGFVTTKVRDQLDQFIFSEDVQVVDVRDSHAQVGVYGPESARVMAAALDLDAAALGALPVCGNRFASFQGADVLVGRFDDVGVPGFDLFLNADDADRCRAAIRAAGAIEADAGAVEVCRVESGRPAFGVDMDEDTIPLEAGIEQRAISFSKGCYVGQEIIIRVLHRGHGRVARRLVGLILDATSEVPAPGDAIRTADRDVGSVTSAVRSAALDRPVALGYVHRDFTEAGTAVTIQERPAAVTSLPFVAA